MQLIQLRYFCTVARCRNMSRAADELWVSQPALSKAIGALEDELGVKLFDRVGRSIQLNDAGRLFYHQISHILFLLNDAANQVRDLEHKNKNQVRVLFSAANFICSWVRENFKARFPDADLVVRDRYVPTPYDLAECDFHIYASPSVYEDMQSVVLLEEELMLAMSTQHPLAGRESIRLADTKGFQFQSLPVHENLYDNLYLFYQKMGMEPDIAFCTEDSFTFFDGLAGSSLLTLVPAYTAFPALTSDLVLRPISEPECRRTLCLGWSGERYVSELGKQFIDFCVELFGGLCPGTRAAPRTPEGEENKRICGKERDSGDGF